MDVNEGYYSTYSSQEHDCQTYPYGSHYEESHNQSYDQQYYEDEQYNGYGQYYEHGGHYEHEEDSYNQQVFCHSGYEQEEEQPDYYGEERDYPIYSYTPNMDDGSNSIDDNAMMKMMTQMMNQQNQFINQQKEMNDMIIRRLDTLEFQLNREIENMHEVDDEDSDEEEFVSKTHRILKELEDEKGSTMEENSLKAFTIPSVIDEIFPFVEVQLEHIEEQSSDLCGDRTGLDMDLSREPPCKQENTSLAMDIEDETPKESIDQLKDGVSINLEASFEDPFLFDVPRDKFWSFLPYFSQSFEDSSNDPVIQKGITHFRGSEVQREVHCRLDGRKFKWDLKVV